MTKLFAKASEENKRATTPTPVALAKCDSFTVGVFGYNHSGAEGIIKHLERLIYQYKIRNACCESVFLDEDNMRSFELAKAYSLCILCFSGTRARYDEIQCYERFFQQVEQGIGLAKAVLVITRVDARKLESRHVRSGYSITDGHLDISYDAEDAFVTKAIKPTSSQCPVARDHVFVISDRFVPLQEHRLLALFVSAGADVGEKFPAPVFGTPSPPRNTTEDADEGPPTAESKRKCSIQ